MSNFPGEHEYQKLFSPKAYLDSFFQLGAGSMGDEYLYFVLKQLAEVFNSGEHEYQKLFSPKAYLDSFFHLGAGSMGDEYLYFVLKQLAEVFNSGEHEYQKLFSPKAYLDSFFHLGAGSMGDEYLYFVLKQLAEVFNSGEHEYQKLFSPKAYLDSFFHLGAGSMGDEYLYFVLKQLAEVFNSGKVKGDTLIDIGTGPSIYQLLSACEAFKNIIVSDFTDKNREEFNVWLKNHPGAFDWSSVTNHVCQLEGDRISCQEKEERLRKTIKQVLKCDVLKTNPIDPFTIPKVDCLLSCLCLEAACKDFETYVTALKNISNLLKLGGYLVLTGILGNTYYMVGEEKFSSLNLNDAFLREAITAAGYTIENFQLYNKTEDSVEELADFSGYFVVIAQKRRDA